MCQNFPHAAPGAGDAASGIIGTVAAAIVRGDVLLAFQPVVSAAAPRRAAFHEALLRIVDEDGSLLPAGAFIDAVEPLELGRTLDAIALDLSLRALRETPSLRLAVNLSPRTIGHPRWTGTLEAGLAADPTVAERLIIELTERSAHEAPEVVGRFAADLRDRGIAFALDDFGAGYTALAQLKTLRFDILKMNGDFFRNIAGDPDNRALVAALVSIARHFEMLTVAEFIETAEDAACARTLGVDCLQGYHFGRPTIAPDWIRPAAIRRAG